jgi:molybdopterin/thiamine biosynthesis adenylyltransferase
MKHNDRIAFKRIGEKGNSRLLGRIVSVAGLGSIGSAVATRLAREDINLRLLDMGRVEEEDMARLQIFQDEDITKFKVKQAKVRLANINPKVQVKCFHEELNESNVFLLEGDVVVDATNSDELNRTVLAYATKKRIPLIIARASGSTARILVTHKTLPAKILERVTLPPKEKEGIFSASTLMAASIVDAEVIKILLGERRSALIECDAWSTKLKVTTL